MNSRSKKYVESHKKVNNRKKDATTVKDSKDQNKKNVKPVQPQVQTSSATQDDTGGGNDSGKRIDEN